MKRRIKTKKKKIKKYKSRNKLKSRKNKKRLKGGAWMAGLALGTGVGALAYMGKDGPRKCMFEDCQSHYYHFRGHRGWWDSSTRFYQGGEKAKRLEGYKDDDYDGKKMVCPKCVERYEEGKKSKLLITTLNGFKYCNNSCGMCDNKYCGNKWWKSYGHSMYKELGFNRMLIYWIDPITNLAKEIYCPECSMMFGENTCLKCNKPLKKIERTNSRVDYCISCYRKFLSPKPSFNLNGTELTIGDILIFQEESKEYKAKIEGIYDDNSFRCEILSIQLNEWNDLQLPWLSNPQSSENYYTMEKTIIVINDLQISLRLLSLAKLSGEEYYNLNEDIINCIKENLVRILNHNVKPWVSIYDPERLEYKRKLESDLKIRQSQNKEDKEREEAQSWGSFPY